MDSVEKVLEKSGFSGLNPVQKEALDAGLLGSDNMVVAAPTASGKTLVAEIAILETVRKNRKAVYIVPLKALASEKYSEFKERYEPLGLRIGLSIGDMDSSDPWLARMDIVIITSEKLDSLLRHGIDWASQIGLVVVDEIHLLDSPNRGPTLEVVLTRLREISNPRVLGLSATISNYEEMADWLNARPVKSDYRPVKLLMGVCFDNKVSFHPKGSMKLNDEEESLGELVVDSVKKGKQALVFVSTRRNAESVAEKMGKLVRPKLTAEERGRLAELSKRVLSAVGHPTAQCKRLSGMVMDGVAFHHAGLAPKQRGLIEDAYREGLVKVIGATPTLAWGVNLPAWRVIIRDTRRFSRGFGSDWLPVLDVQQMCLPGNAEILSGDGSYQRIENIIKKQDISVHSLNTENGAIQDKKVLKKISRQATELVNIKTDSGREMEATPEHPVLVFEKGTTWKPVGGLKEGDLVGVVRKIKINQKIPRFVEYLDGDIYVKNGMEIIRFLRKTSGKGYKQFAEILNVPYKTIKSYAYNKSVPLKHINKLSNFLSIDHDIVTGLLENREFKSKYGSCITLPRHITEDFTWLLGIIVSDGNITEYKGCGKWNGTLYSVMKLSNNNKSIINKTKRILDSFEIKYYEYSSKSGFVPEKKIWRIDVCNQAFIKLLNNFGIPSGKKSDIIEMKEIFNLPDNLIGGFIAGLFDGDGNFSILTPSVRLSSLSKHLIINCQRLLLRFGIRSTIHKERDSYCISISRKNDINRFFSQIPCVRIKSDKLYLRRDTRPVISFGNIVFEKINFIEKRVLDKPIKVYNISVEGNENYVCNDFVVHNCGRAGRPKYDSDGQAIIMAKSRRDAEYAWENYVKGEPERIFSKLGVEPVLRMHALSLISSGVTPTMSSLKSFFGRTFYAHQYGDMERLNAMLLKVVAMLEEFGFVETDRQAEDTGPFRTGSSMMEDLKLRATRIGKRVSELYIDPITANHFMRNMEVAEKGSGGDLGYLHLMSNTMEMHPPLGIRKNDESLINEILVKDEKEMIQKPPNPWDMEYEDYIRSVKTAMMFREWMNESGEDHILEGFGVSPGELHTRLNNADWLLYSMQELALLMGCRSILKDIRKVRLRVKHGVREELLPLIKLRGIGRVRARRLFSSNLKTLDSLRKVPEETLSRILGPKTAREVKDQL